MILTLNIQNFALIKELRVDFSKGLNILSGETGAGKSIIIDALSFLLGGRAEKSLIRNGQNTCKIDGVFSIEKNIHNNQAFEKIGLEFSDQVLISRTITLDGRSDAKINGQIVTISMLKEFSSNLIDIYGQHEHQQILKEKYQILLIDNYNKQEIEPIKNKYNLKLINYKKIISELNSFGGSNEERLRQIDLLQYQIKEIENAHFQINEEENLLLEKKKLINLERIITNLKDALDNLNSVSQISNAVKNILNASKFDESLNILSNKLNSVYYDLTDINEEIENYVKNSYFDINALEHIEKRIDLINDFKRKYGNSIEQIIEYANKSKEELTKLEQSSEIILNLQQQKQKCLNELFCLNNELSNLRKNTAEKLEKLLTEQLIQLGMEKIQIKFSFNEQINFENFENALKSDGTDSVEILFSANFGEQMKPLNKIISGGEMSRFMLALKAVTADSYAIPTMIFDEIDVGISGKTAHAVSLVISKISKSHQVIAISHLFQIVAMADSHFYVSKTSNEIETYTSIVNLNRTQQIEDIARMISGSEITITTMEHAKELKDWCDNHKRQL